MFEDVKNVAQAMVKIKAGEELGFTPFVSMGGVHVIKGKPSLGATLQASLLKGLAAVSVRDETDRQRGMHARFL
jgi:hypothetical protein